ncbi:MAG: zf-HC2 domain-containing protein [Deltaproteobacteria bacterium]|nr:zf-HC2 domain-containing protein [Deltaproteobacteria bacterium]MBW2664986.1 zf-HC2 domain-containing protein [Deltaproteobacteria bacterium]
MSDHSHDPRGHVLDRLGDHLEGDLTPEDFTRVDAHLAECSACMAELRELRETVALLRGLPDPVPPPRLVAGVMQRIEVEGDSRGRVIELFREVAQPRVIAALAAGIAALALFSTLDVGEGGLLGPSSDPDRGLIARRDVPAGVPDAGAESARRPRSLSPAPAAPGSFPRRQQAILVGLEPRVMPPRRAMAISEAPRYGIFGSAAPEVPLRDLESEFEALMADPQAFLDRVERTSASARRPMIAPLVEHSVRRGGVSEINRFLGRAAAPVAVPVSTAR